MGDPLKGVGVGLGKKPNPSASIIATAQTDASGVFRFLNVPPGEYVLTVQCQWCQKSNGPAYYTNVEVVNNSRSNIKNNGVVAKSAAAEPLVTGPNVVNGQLHIATAPNPGQSLLLSEDITLTSAADITGVISVKDVNLSTTSLRFVAIEGGSAPLSQGLQISSASDNTVFYSAVFTADARSGSWSANLSNPNGAASSGNPTAIELRPSVTGLNPGTYLGHIKISFRDADRVFDRVAAATLVVLPRGDAGKLAPVVSRKMQISHLLTDGITFQPHNITVTNIGPAAQSYSVGEPASTSGHAVTVSPGQFSLAPGASQTVQIEWRMTATKLAPLAEKTEPEKDCVTVKNSQGQSFTYCQLPADRLICEKQVETDTQLAPLKCSGQIAVNGNPSPCVPTRLIPVITRLDAVAVSGHALNGSLQVWDDCATERFDYSAQIRFGDPGAQQVIGYSPTARAVTTKGISGNIAIDPGFAIQPSAPISGGWDIKGTNKGLIAVQAHISDPITGVELDGSISIDVPIEFNPATPYLSPGGAVSAASFEPIGIAPGEIVAVFGVFPGVQPESANKTPLPSELGGLSLEVDGKPVPLFYASNSQINGIVPFGTTPGAHSLLLKQAGLPPNRAAFTSSPMEINVVAANPAAFTTNASGSGQAHVYKLIDGKQILVDAANPAQTGDVLVMYYSGLGDVSGNVVTGDVAPLILLPVKPAVTVKIGGNDAKVLYSGLTPGSASLYQINVIVGEVLRPPPPPIFKSVTRGAESNVLALPIEVNAGGALSGESVTGYFLTGVNSRISVSFVTSLPGLSISVNNKTVQGNSGLLYFDPGTPIVLDVPSLVQSSGSADVRYRFSGWSQGGPVSQTIAPSVSTAYAAYFSTEFKLTTSITAPATIGISPASTDGFYPAGTAIQATATCPAGSSASGAVGETLGASPSQATGSTAAFVIQTRTLLSFRCVPDNAVANVLLTVATNPAGLAARIASAGAFSASPIQQQVPANQIQTISVADPQFVSTTGTGYSFTGWSTGGSTATTTVQPSSNFTATAMFKVACYVLTVNVTPAASGTVTANPTSGGLPQPLPSNCYAPGSTVTLTAKGNNGNALSAWTGATGTGNTATVIVNAAMTVTATFATPPLLTVFYQSRPVGGANLSMGIRNTGGTAATNVTVTSIMPAAPFVYNPGLLVIPFVIPGAANLRPGDTSGFNQNFTATSGSAGAPFSFVITVRADNVAPFSTTINVP